MHGLRLPHVRLAADACTTLQSRAKALTRIGSGAANEEPDNVRLDAPGDRTEGSLRVGAGRLSALAALLFALVMPACAADHAHAGGGVALRLSQTLQPGLDEGILLVVTLAPGEISAPHRHDAHVFVYVLEGEVLMQVQGGPERRLKPGDVFEEKPGDIHTQARNLSAAAPARFAVFMVKKAGQPAVLPVK